MKIRKLRHPDGRVFANIDDMISLFKDIRENIEKYNREAVVTVIGKLAGKISIEEEKKTENPF